MNTLEAHGLTKVYPGTLALNDFSARFEGGKVHAVIGKNGCGKSTMVKIFSGAIQPTEGYVSVNGKRVELTSPKDSFSEGIAAVYQELSLIPELTVAENIFLGRLPKTSRNLIDWQETNRKAKEILDAFKVDISVTKKIRELNVWQQQVIEIAKAMSSNPSVLILDEPTSALARNESEKLFTAIKHLKSNGVVIIYITHRLQELYLVADTVTVLRDGRKIGIENINDITPKEIVTMMFGDVVQKQRPVDLPISDKTVLAVRNLTSKAHFRDISFDLKRGEILGIAGMLGSGRSELLRCIFGADVFDSGEITVEGSLIKEHSIKAMKKHGLAMTPENRKEEGLVMCLSTRENLVLANLRSLRNGIYIDQSIESKIVNHLVETLEIKIPGVNYPVSSLSGGNQQKVIVGNWINSKPKIMFFDEPSRGIDVNAKQQIFEIMWKLSREGVASIMVSSELEELIEVCHRILILHHGRLVGQVMANEVKLEDLYTSCMEGQIL